MHYHYYIYLAKTSVSIHISLCNANGQNDEKIIFFIKLTCKETIKVKIQSCIVF